MSRNRARSRGAYKAVHVEDDCLDVGTWSYPCCIRIRHRCCGGRRERGGWWWELTAINFRLGCWPPPPAYLHTQDGFRRACLLRDRSRSPSLTLRFCSSSSSSPRPPLPPPAPALSPSPPKFSHACWSLPLNTTTFPPSDKYSATRLSWFAPGDPELKRLLFAEPSLSTKSAVRSWLLSKGRYAFTKLSMLSAEGHADREAEDAWTEADFRRVLDACRRGLRTLQVDWALDMDVSVLQHEALKGGSFCGMVEVAEC